MAARLRLCAALNAVIPSEVPRALVPRDFYGRGTKKGSRVDG
jgi:hypothetical protein